MFFSFLLESPLVFPANLLLFLGRKVVLDVKCLANLLGSFALDHIRHRLACQVQQALDVQVVCSLHIYPYNNPQAGKEKLRNNSFFKRDQIPHAKETSASTKHTHIHQLSLVRIFLIIAHIT